MPRTGLPDDFSSFADYERHVKALVDASIIQDGTKLWWDIRPSARFPTLEMRIADVCTYLHDAASVAALYTSIMRMLWRLKTHNQRWRQYSAMLIAENRWRAQRYGLDEGLVDFGKGKIVLDDAAVFVINIPGVWGVNLVSIWLAFGIGVGWGLIGVYLTLVNALAHIGQAIRLRSYNPGLATAVVLFLPVSIAGALIIGAVPGVGAGHHLVGLAVAIAIHAGIIAYVFTRRRRLA